MFEELKQKLESIDSVLDEESESDIDLSNFDSSKNYTREELKKFGRLKYCVEILKKSGGESKYLMIEVIVQKNDEKYSKTYLRGFDFRYGSHHLMIYEFMKEELGKRLSSKFVFPDRWPKMRDSRDDALLHSLTLENSDEKITISALGGGKFDLKNKSINLSGSSQAFGSIPRAYEDRFKELMQQ